MSEKKFTISDGIRCQKEQLGNWKRKLIPEVYDALEKEALVDNHKAKSGYDIFRGSDMDVFVANY